MTNLPNLALMSVVEYVDFLESRALHLGIDVFTLNMEYCFEMGSISNERYERAKAEIYSRHEKCVNSDDDGYNYYIS
jgi:hypothetical protein